MSETRPIVERLRGQYRLPIEKEAADTIERLKTALAPFAYYAYQIDANETSKGYPDSCGVSISPETRDPFVTVGDLRRAREALRKL